MSVLARTDALICVVGDKGKVAAEVTVLTDPDAIKPALKPYLGRLRRLGHEPRLILASAAGELLKLGRPARQ
jgi:transposase